jgi:hypothetical protein
LGNRHLSTDLRRRDSPTSADPWDDIETEAELIRVRQQLQRVQGQLILGPVKTRAGNRELPLIGLAKNALAARRMLSGLAEVV